MRPRALFITVMHRLLSLVARTLCALALVGRAAPATAQRLLPPNGAGSTSSSYPSHLPTLTLDMLLVAVRDGHPTIRAALARVRAAEGMRVTAGRLGNPILSYQVENTAFPLARSVAGIDRETMEMATLPLEPIYLRGSRVARTAAEVRAARAEAERERQRVGLDAAGAFYRVALARVTAEMGRDLVAWLDSLVAYNRARAREGVASEADLLRSALERDRAAAEATMADAELAQAAAQLVAALGAPTGGPVEIAAGESPLALVSAGEGRFADGVALASTVSLRPDVRAARERETAASAGISTERRLLFREAGATLGVKQTMGTSSMIAGLSLPFPLFDQNRGEVARAAAERDVARFDLAAQERLATADVAGSLAAARLLTTRAQTLAQPGQDGLLGRADEMRRIALGAYREGAIPLVQVLDAARAWADTRLTYYRTLYAQHQAVLALIVATGGDLFTAPLTPTSGSSR
jgi:cobalt-zinc-cadmium efflux system outer membrane protein